MRCTSAASLYKGSEAVKRRLQARDLSTHGGYIRGAGFGNGKQIARPILFERQLGYEDRVLRPQIRLTFARRVQLAPRLLLSGGILVAQRIRALL